MGWIGVITDAGNTAFERSLAEAEELNLNVVSVGTGYISPASMKAATSLDTPVGTGILESKESLSTGVRIVASIVPMASAYTIKEVGIYGTIGSDNVLFALYQNADGIPIPSVSEFPDYSYTLSAILDIDDLGTLTITIDPTALVTQTALATGLATKVNIDQGVANAGKFLVVNNSGQVEPMTVPFANGVSF